MASFTLSRNLKLRLDSNLTANSIYNLQKIDALAAVYLVDTSDSLRIRSLSDINLEPNSADIGGSGSGGTVRIGIPGNDLDLLQVNASTVTFSTAVGLADQGTGGNKQLNISYDSTLSGSVDTAANRSLSVDVDGGDRELILAANLSLLGSNLVLNTTAPSSVIFPVTGTLATLAGVETLTNKTINANNNTITNIGDSNISPSKLSYSVLNLTGSIVNADVSNSAAIAYSKLNLAGGIVNADINNSAAIAYSKLLLTGSITNTDISSSANISGSKIVSIFGNQIVSTEDRIRLGGGSYYTELRRAQSGQSSNLIFNLPPDSTSGVLQNDGAGNLSWVSVGGVGTVTSVALSLPSIFSVSGSPVTTAGTLTGSLANQTANSVFAGPTSGGAAAPTFRSIVDADLPVGNLTVDHTSVSITTAANSGLSGGGTIAATRSLTIDPSNAPAVTVAGADIILFADASNANALSRTTVADIVALASGSVSKFSATWANADGTSKVVTHSLGTKDVQVQVYDMANDETVEVDSVIRTDINNITLTASAAPATSWRVVVLG